MKLNKVMKLCIALLLIGIIIPTASAKKETYNVKATAKGLYTIGEQSYPVGLRVLTKLTPNEDNYSRSPAKIGMSFMLPEGGKDNAMIKGFIIPGYGDVGLELKLEINGQFLPITQKILEDGSKIWVTEDAEYVLRNGQEITLNLVWNFQVEIEGLYAGH